MKHAINILALALIFLSGFTFGKLYSKETNQEIQNEISIRYFKTIGNPKNKLQQCNFDYIIYNDSTECK